MINPLYRDHKVAEVNLRPFPLTSTDETADYSLLTCSNNSSILSMSSIFGWFFILPILSSCIIKCQTWTKRRFFRITFGLWSKIWSLMLGYDIFIIMFAFKSIMACLNYYKLYVLNSYPNPHSLSKDSSKSLLNMAIKIFLLYCLFSMNMAHAAWMRSFICDFGRLSTNGFIICFNVMLRP